MTAQIIPILLAGGAGTRLWPVSRDALPKQLLPLVGERSTYQETLLRVHSDGLMPKVTMAPASAAARPAAQVCRNASRSRMM
jgi:mannose-1-phosphate guanylyltransferase